MSLHRSLSLSRLPAAAVLTPLVALLCACGGGGNSTVADSAPAAGASTAAQRSSFIADYGSGVAALDSYGGLTATAFVELFDDAFLDAGYTKAQVRAGLAQEAAALSTAPELSSFAAVRLSDMAIGACDAANICTLTGTLTNSDADTTAVGFSTRVRLQDGRFRLYGDQTAAAT